MNQKFVFWWVMTDLYASDKRHGGVASMKDKIWEVRLECPGHMERGQSVTLVRMCERISTLHSKRGRGTSKNHHYEVTMLDLAHLQPSKHIDQI